MGRMMHYGWSCGPFAMIGGPWGTILTLVFWGLLIAGAIWLGTRLLRRGETTPSGETPLDVLKRRYAAGEIRRDDFERMSREVSR
ncbi:MAG: SHOCT domain-containing protein [Deferrisomatales bacterium]